MVVTKTATCQHCGAQMILAKAADSFVPVDTFTAWCQRLDIEARSTVNGNVVYRMGTMCWRSIPRQADAA